MKEQTGAVKYFCQDLHICPCTAPFKKFRVHSSRDWHDATAHCSVTRDGFSVHKGNVRSIKNDLEELEFQLSLAPCSIFAFSETWLKDEVPNFEITDQSFWVFRKDRTGAGGSVMTIITPYFLAKLLMILTT